jgi:hypothetical protein
MLKNKVLTTLLGVLVLLSPSKAQSGGSHVGGIFLGFC